MLGWFGRLLGETARRSSSRDRLPAPGEVLGGKYRIERLLGRGGMGAVLAAHHLLLEQSVAVKVLVGESAGEEETAERFLREARAVAKLTGEHVARVMDVDRRDDGMPFIVMEYLEGADLGQLLRNNGPLPPSDVVDYVLQAIDALGQAHAHGIVHRDIKPSNLFLAQRPDGSRVIKVLDFGVSKSMSPSQMASLGTLTGTHSVVGSPCYMSPEQIRSPRSVDARSDIWSIGVVMYELLAGRLPFSGEHWGELFAAVLESDAPPLRSLAPGVSPELERIVARCLARDPRERYPDIAALGEDLAPLGSRRWALVPSRIRQSLARKAQNELSLATTDAASPVQVQETSADVLPTASTVNRGDGVSVLRDTKTRRLIAISASCGVALAGVLVYLARPTDRTPASPMPSAPASVDLPPPPAASSLPAPAVVVASPDSAAPSASALPPRPTTVPKTAPPARVPKPPAVAVPPELRGPRT